MADSGGGHDKDLQPAARFSIPNDEDDDELTEEERRHHDVTVATLNNVFSRDLQIFHQIDDTINEVWAQKPCKVICNYIFGREIGHGSYGKVKEVFHRSSRSVYAVKIMKDKKVCKIPYGISNVEKEFRILDKLDHKNVIKLFESFRVDAREKLYYIFEFCVISIDGLLETVDPSRMNEYQAHYYFKQLVEGLGYLHKAGVIHKDIKPQNLLVTEDGILKIADFGVAELFPDPSNDWCKLSQGTPALQAPEVIGNEQKDFRGRGIDIWAAGVTLYRIVTGRYPFDGDVLMTLFENIVKEPVTIPPTVDLSPGVVELISGMLVKKPEDRWTMQQIKDSKWVAAFHNVNEVNIINLPVVEHTYFEDYIQDIEDNPDDVVVVTDAVPFHGTYPSSVQDRTLQTPATSKSFKFDREAHIDPESRVALTPTGGDLPLPNAPLVRANSLGHEDTSDNHEGEQPEQDSRRPQRSRRRHGSCFSCLKPKTNSPEDSPN